MKLSVAKLFDRVDKLVSSSILTHKPLHCEGFVILGFIESPTVH